MRPIITVVVQILLTPRSSFRDYLCMDRLADGPRHEAEANPPAAAPSHDDGAGRPLEDHLEEFRRERLGIGQAKRHVAYVVRYVGYAAKHGRWARITDATEDAALAYLGQLTNHAGDCASPKYYNNVLGYLQAFFGWAVARKRLDRNPVAAIEPRIDRRGEQIRAFTPAEFVALIHATEPRLGGAEAVFVYKLAAATGMRRSELKGLRKADLHLDDAEPHVLLQPYAYKGGRRKPRPERIPLVSRQLIEQLRARVELLEPLGKVIRTVPHPNVVQDDIRRAGLVNPDPLGRRLVLHSLRHMLGTVLAIAGVDVRRIQAVLRHRDIRTTQRYIDAAQLPTASALREVSRVLGDFFRA